MANYSGNIVVNGINTFDLFTAPEAGNYNIDVKLELSHISSGGAASACVCILKKGGVAQYTGAAGASGARLELLLAAGDVMTMQLSSSAAVDIALNGVKGVVAFSEGL